MKRIFLVIFILLFPIRFVFSGEYKNEVLIMYKDGSISKTSGSKKISKLTVPEDMTLEQFISELKKRDDILYAEPNYILKAIALPNDPNFYDSSGNPQWWWTVINAPEAWDVTTGSQTVYVAVVDTGVDYTHNDLKNNLWVNGDELLNTDNNNNGIDDGCEDGTDNDGNGYIDDCYGINALCYQYDQNGNLVYNNQLSGCLRSDAFDDDGHGTHVAGIIGAVANNNFGTAGVNWQIKIIPCKFLDSNGNGSIDGELICLDYINKLKTTKNLKIIAVNASYGGEYPGSDIEKNKISSLNGMLFVSAAGNEGDNNELISFNPCNYDLPNQICVGASDQTNNRALFSLSLASNYGTQKVKIFAPGKEIYSTYLNNQFKSISGTSQAAPFVSGAAALLYSFNQTLSVDQIKDKLIYSGSNHPDKLSGYSYSCNILNLKNLFQTSTEEKLCIDTNSITFGSIPVGTSESITVNVKNTGETPLNISSIYSTESSFKVSNTCENNQIPVKSACSITVEFHPNLATNYIGTLIISYGNNKSLSIKLEGTGTTGSYSDYLTFPEVKGSEGCKFSKGTDYIFLTAYIFLILSIIFRRYNKRYG
ncbi:S8 family serine peptidase [Persephonella sp.]